MDATTLLTNTDMLLSKVLAMDETAIKAGRAKGKMKAGWFWPVMSEDEIVFTYSPTRGRQQIEKLLNDMFEGTLIFQSGSWRRPCETT